jgi:hypothetical protein
MRLSLEERKQTESALAAAHDELVRRGQQLADESLRRADEFDELWKERRRLERVWSVGRISTRLSKSA